MTTQNARLAAGAKQFAALETISYDEQILSSDRLWENTILLLGDDCSPDLLPALVRRATHSLLELGARRGVALDWSTFRVHVHRLGSSSELTLITRVDVL